MTDCSVCCETVKCIECPYCKFVSCEECTSTFLLGLSKDSHCMNCNKLWNREVLTQLLSKKFINGKYKWHRENVLFEREKSLFPQTQPAVVREKRFEELRAIEKKTIQVLTKESGYSPRPYHPRLLELREARRRLQHLDTRRFLRGLVAEAEVEVPKKKFVRKCPVGNCQGFLSTSWKCGLCSNSICKDCNEIRDEDHECDPGNVETVKLLAKDTKPCPKCGEMIFKASGCSQMWCTSCHCVFDWNTMRVDTGVVHNPHYYEYHRQNGTLQRQPGDVPCGGNDALPEFYRFLWIRPVIPEIGYIGDVHRLCQHALHNYRQPGEDPNIENRKLFMKGKISECQFKFRIQKNEKAREKKRDVQNVHEMFGNVLKDLLVQLLNGVIQVQGLRDMVNNLIEYTNEVLRKVKVLYDNCVMEFIDAEKLVMVSDSKKAVVV
jgi:hypothetical protein